MPLRLPSVLPLWRRWLPALSLWLRLRLRLRLGLRAGFVGTDPGGLALAGIGA